MNLTISIIIPVFNEAAHIGKLLTYLLNNINWEHIAEIIVVDGESTDETKRIILGFGQVAYVNAPKGRASQMNAGAFTAKGDLLYFLHADTFPPLGFDRKVIEASKSYHAGCFRLKFKNPDHFLLRLAPWFTRFNSQIFRGGDQSLFIRKDSFMFLEGFNEDYAICEDIEFIGRIKQHFSFKVINDYVVTSERRFRRNGTLALYFNFLVIHLKNWRGESPEALHQYYVNHIRE